MMMVITSLIVSPLSRWRCFLPSLNRGCWAFNSGKVPWQNSSQSTKSCTMSISVLLFVVVTSGANLSRFLTQKGVPRLYDRAYLLTLLQLLHRTHVIVHNRAELHAHELSRLAGAVGGLALRLFPLSINPLIVSLTLLQVAPGSLFRPGSRAALPLPRPSSQAGLLPPSPLGTDRESLPSISSSLSNALCRTRFHHFFSHSSECQGLG